MFLSSNRRLGKGRAKRFMQAVRLAYLHITVVPKYTKKSPRKRQDLGKKGKHASTSTSLLRKHFLTDRKAELHRNSTVPWRTVRVMLYFFQDSKRLHLGIRMTNTKWHEFAREESFYNFFVLQSGFSAPAFGVIFLPFFTIYHQLASVCDFRPGRWPLEH